MAAAQDAEETAKAFGVTDMVPMARAVGLRCLLWMQGPEAVREFWEEADAQPPLDSAWLRLSVSTTMVEVAFQGGIAPPAGPGPGVRARDQTWQLDPTQATRWAYAAQVALAQGDSERAQTWAERAVATAEPMGLDWQLGLACLALGEIELAGRDPGRRPRGRARHRGVHAGA